MHLAKVRACLPSLTRPLISDDDDDDDDDDDASSVAALFPRALYRQIRIA